MEVRRCMKCMHELAAGQTVCPECGRTYGSAEAESFALKPGTILDGKYLVGEMLGQGGFGITYIGFDLLLEQKVAIKEYFPLSTGMVSRESSSTVVWSSAMMGKTGTQKGFDSFLKEARKMAKLGGIPGVVGVRSVFIQNETAYIVMDFIEGETLLKKLQREGPTKYDDCLSMLTPIIQAMAEVHKHGIIHRDISPDNIMVQTNGRPVLLDLGAAKDIDIQGAGGTVQSSQMVAKHGFSPVEQYGQAGKTGTWTDVYAMAATIYYCCTGVLPPSATDRTIDDTLSRKPLLTQNQFDAISLCMSVLPKNRPQDMGAMLQVLTAAGVPKTEPVEPPKKTEPVTPRETEPVGQTPPPGTEPGKPKEKRQWRKWSPSTIAAVIVALILAVGINGRMVFKKAAPAEQPAQTIPMETNGWKKIGDDYYYYQMGVKATGQITIEGNVYFFDSEGIMHTGWLEIDGHQYYFDKDGKMVTGEQNIDSEACTFNDQGRLIQKVRMLKVTEIPSSVSSPDDTNYIRNDGKTGKGKYQILSKPIKNCTKITVALSVSNLKAGTVDEWGFYIRNLNGEWFRVGDIEVKDKVSGSADFSFDTPVNFNAYVCLCESLGSYWEFNFSQKLSNIEVVEQY